MTLLFIAAIALILFAALFHRLREDATGGSLLEGLYGVLAGVSAIAAAIAMLAVSCFSYGWMASEHRARIINREYGTNYTQAEVFYASDMIETVRELDRKRIDARLKVDDDQATATK